MKRRVALLVGLGLSGLFLWLALRGVAFGELASRLRGADFFWGLPLLASLGLFYWLKAVRWRILLTPTFKTTAGEVFPAMMIGFAGNNLLPARLGELLRMYVLSKQKGVSRSAVLGSIALERVFDFLTVVLLLGVALVTGSRSSPELERAGYAFAILGLGFLLLSWAAVIWTDSLVGVVRRIASWMPDRVGVVVVGGVERGVRGLGALKEPSLVGWTIVTSLLQWSLIVVAIDCGLRAVDLDLPWNAAILTLVLTVAGMTLPSSPGFFGTIELCFVLALKLFDVGKEAALAAAVFYHLSAFVAVTATGLFFLSRLGFRLSRLEQEAMDSRSA